MRFKFLNIGILVAFLAAIFLAFMHSQDIQDWIRLRNYTAPANIAAFVAQDSMTPKAQHIFYVTHPTLETNLGSFQKECANSEQTIVLGCYRTGVASDSQLFIRDITDSRLQGVEQVTAAHEMLHAAYDRLGASQKQAIDTMLQDYYRTQLNDQRIKDTIESYKKTEPDDLVNEMHSIFGTEISSLPAPLEEYYKQYFANRKQITDYAQAYEGEFTSRKAQVDADDAKLAELKTRIKTEEQALQEQLSALQSDRASVENSNDQAAVNEYNSRVVSYNAGIRRLQSDISAYNTLVEERNQIAAELQSLQSSIDTRLTTQQAQ